MDSEKSNSNLHNVSFSSYNSTAKEISVHKPAESVQAPGPSCLERTKIEEGEISVFGAERYFSMKLDDDSSRLDDNHGSRHGLRGENQVDQQQMKPGFRPGTPSIRSESSSNSHTALLQSFARNQSASKVKRIDSRGFFSGLACTGSCSDGKSVSINQNVENRRIHHGKEYGKQPVRRNHKTLVSDRWKQPQFDSRSIEKMSVGSSREEYFAPAIPKAGSVKIQPGKSPRVFGSSSLTKGDIAFNLERKLSMLTWDAIPNSPNLPSGFFGSQGDDDIESDASSDLFEIENVSSNIGQGPFTRQESDGMSNCITPYEPSETSIEWSVVTASAADFSVVSDYDEKKLTRSSTLPGSKTAGTVANAKSILDKEAQQSKPSGILGCKSHKAVRVAETAYSFDQKTKPPHLPQPPKSATLTPVKLLQADLR
ncbi:hypothetical protein SLE2022_290440 [Rubroshorea leprosula]